MTFSKAREYIPLVALLLVITGGIFWVIGLLLYAYLRYEPQEGDIIFQSLPLNLDLVVAIEGVTESPLSHVGIVVKKKDGWYVREAIYDVHDIKLFNWIKRGRGYKYLVYRFKDNARKYIPDIITATKQYLGRPYDTHYEFDDKNIYCSELIFKAFKNVTGEDLGQVVTLGELNWQPHEALIRKMEKGNLPLDRLMITPRDLARAPQLQKVISNGL